MAKKAKILEISATITDRGQTTVPAAIRGMLNLGKRDRVVFSALADGTVLIARQSEPEPHLDPTIGHFLAFLDRDMERTPERLRAVPPGLIQRARALVDGMDVDLEARLPNDEE